MKSSYIILPAALFIISCNSSPKKPDVVEHFVTHITEDGTKQFNYTLVISSQNNERHKVADVTVIMAAAENKEEKVDKAEIEETQEMIMVNLTKRLR